MSSTGSRREDTVNRLTRKLERYVRLGAEERVLLDQVTRSVDRIGARCDIVCEGNNSDHVHVIVEGMACRYKITSEGRRQVVAFLLPGDFCDLRLGLLSEMDHSVATLSECRVARIPREQIERMAARPLLARALWSAALADEAVLFEWLVNLGARDARSNLAHLFCELLIRLRAAGLTSGDSYKLPLTQQDLADTAGLSSVHVNRVLQSLRSDGLISFDGKSLSILDAERLSELSGFDASYLQLGRHEPPARNLDAQSLADRLTAAE
nr:Crp/Fnr family transcriptional regulator [Bradyrhizobium sp. STM 3843]